jgi:hypothetical protein
VFAIAAFLAAWGIATPAIEMGKQSADKPSSIDLPLSFEPNRGQSRGGVRFVARGPGYTLYLTEEGSSFQFATAQEQVSDRSASEFSIKLAGQRKSRSALIGLDEQPSKSSYFTGPDPAKWLTGIPNFSRVRRRGIYEGIDATYYGSHGQFECEFTIAPHAKPDSIALEILGARHIRKDRRGDIVFNVANVEMRLQKPISRQDVRGSRRVIPSDYVVSKNLLTLRLGRYDTGKILVIDPVLSYSGYLKQKDADSLTAPGIQSVDCLSNTVCRLPNRRMHRSEGGPETET